MRRDYATRRPATRRDMGLRARPSVEAMEKRALLTAFVVKSVADDPMAMDPNSLRSIIIASNAAGGTNSITFNLPAGPQAINLTRALPAITTPTSIDASSLAAGGVPQVFINGSGIVAGGDGFDLTAGNSAVIGLGIVGFSGSGVSLTVAGNNTVSGDYIGINATGSAAASNGADGVTIGSGSGGNTISGNLLSGNKGYGVRVDGQFAGSATTVTSGNTIAGNMIGLNSGGTGASANGFGGVYVRNAPNTTIGGVGGSDRNVISGNRFTIISGAQYGTGDGIDVLGGSDGTTILGNYIGTNLYGTAAVGNFTAGINLNDAGTTTIGGAAGNIISGNRSDGIDGSTFGGTLTIQANYIGTDANGTRAVANAGDGINISGLGSVGDVLIGGTDGDTTRNVISANLGNGITLTGSNVQVQGNYIGVGAAGISNLGNGGYGVDAGFFQNYIGGQDTNSDTTYGNLIANNGLGGVTSNASATVTYNAIYNNTGRGISNTLFTPVPAPVLNRANSMVNTSDIEGTLAAPDGTYLLQFFANTVATPGRAQGQTYLGSATVTVAGGAAAFAATAAGFAQPSYVTATATQLTPGDVNNPGTFGATSAFSTAFLGTGLGPTNSPPTLSLAALPASVNAGDNITYTFTITNNTSSEDDGVVFSNPIPAGVTFFSGTTSSGAPVVLTDGVANAQIGQIAANSSVTVTVILTAGPVASITNSAGVTATNPTILAGQDTITAPTVTVVPSADLAVQVVGPVGSIPVGQNLTYTVTISNYGPSDATNVSLVDTLPTNTIFVSASTSSTTAGDAPTNSGNQVNATIALISSGSVVTYTITVATTRTTPPSVSDTATVTGAQGDPDTSSNTATATTTIIPSADVAIASEVASTASIQAGDTFTLTINVVNNGPSPAAGVVVTDILPAGLAFVSGTAAGGAVTVSNGVVTAPVGSLAIGGTSTVTLVVRAVGAGTISDAASIASTYGDPTPGNNTSSASVTINPVSDLAVTLAQSVSTLNTGNPLPFTAVVTNAGPSPTTNTVFTLPLPAGATFQSATINGVSGGTFVNGTFTVVLSTVAGGGSATIIVTLIPTVATTVTTTATVSATEFDSNPGNNTASVTTVLNVPNPFIAFSAPAYTANETDGTVPITLSRIGDTSGTLTVHFSTVAGGNATAGLDYTPISTTVTFLPGQATVTVNVPILANPYDRADEYVAIQLDTPTNASLSGGAATAIAGIRIVNIDPVIVGPTVADVKLYGPRNAITGIEVDTTGNLDPTTAANAANYTILALGGGSIPYGTAIPVTQAVYNPATGAVLLIPARSLPANELFLVVINGTTAGAVADRAGNPLNSTFGVTAGSNYALTVARGTNLRYTDENGSRVNLKLSGPGTLDLNRTLGGAVGRLEILGATRASSLTGSVGPRGRSSNIGVITGIGRFGTVLTHLYSPPFTVSNATFPNPTDLVNYPSGDVLTGSASASATVSSRSIRRTVHAKAVAVTTRARHSHPAPTHKHADR